MTESETRHGKLIQINPKVAGTINEQPKKLSLIQGIQYSGYIKKIEDNNIANLARTHYAKKFPISLKKNAQIWEISINELKMTDNSTSFGKKILWIRKKIKL